jgi:hypothetical protein
MKRFATSILTILALVSLALADSPHFKRAPRLTDNGLTVSASGAIAGLGNGNVIVTLDFPNATATTICTNQGGNEAPGQNPAAPVEVSGSVLIDRVKNGNVSFSLTTIAPDNPTWDVAGCQNSNWSASIDDINFGAGTLVVQQETFQGSGVYEVVLSLNVFL